MNEILDRIASLEADLTHAYLLRKELERRLEEKGIELLRYKQTLAKILNMSLTYTGIEEMDKISEFIKEFVEKEVRG
jgi:hypothetical protein